MLIQVCYRFPSEISSVKEDVRDKKTDNRRIDETQKWHYREMLRTKAQDQARVSFLIQRFQAPISLNNKDF